MSIHNHIPGALAAALFIALAVLLHGVVAAGDSGATAAMPDGPVIVSGLD
ncbi:MAG: hypothetical protein ACOY3X_00810 [Pseudomonadota bacterium]